MTGLITAGIGAVCLVVAGYMVSPAVGLAVTGLFALLLGLLGEFGDDT